MINGKHYSWEDITINTPWGTAVEIQDISYDDELEKEVVYGRGSKATGYGTGNYKASGKVSMTREEFSKITDYCKRNRIPLYKIPPFPIVVSYADDGLPTNIDTLKQCTFTKTSNKAAQGDKSFKVDLDFVIIDQIIRNGVAAV